jgi:hypothetical protein
MKNNDESEARAAIFLWNEAHKLVTALEHMAQKRPELFRLVARKTFYWPGFISRKRVFGAKYAELMDKIELGADLPYSRKQWRLAAPTTRTAMELHLYCCSYNKQWQLPPLTTKKNKQVRTLRSVLGAGPGLARSEETCNGRNRRKVDFTNPIRPKLAQHFSPVQATHASARATPGLPRDVK